MNAECLAYMFTILGIRIEIFSPFSRLRPYHRENTGSRLITEVKPCRAGLVLGWVTAWEYPVL